MQSNYFSLKFGNHKMLFILSIFNLTIDLVVFFKNFGKSYVLLINKIKNNYIIMKIWCKNSNY